MNNKLVSIIVAAYNAEEYIDDCINSILNQTYSNWELWICDDASTDNTFNIINRYSLSDKRIHCLRNESTSFSATCRNRCLEQCEGYYVAIQDADDVSECNRLEILVNTIETSYFDFVSSGHYLFDDNGKYKSVIPKKKYPDSLDFIHGTPFCHAATLFTRDCLVAVGGYRVSKETRRGQDYDLFMRLYANGFKGLNIENELYGYRVDENTIRRRKLRYRLDECLIRFKGFKSLGLLPRYILFVFKPIPAYFVHLFIRR